MALQLRDGSQFLHIPKTGGSWVSAILHEALVVSSYLVDKHTPFDMVLFADRLSVHVMPWDKTRMRRIGYPAFMGKPWVVKNMLRHTLNPFRPYRHPSTGSETFRFAFVRHPLAWYESYWRFGMSNGVHEWGDPVHRDNWHVWSVLNGCWSDDFNAWMHNVVRQRPGFVSELFYSFTKRGINYIGKNETLREDLAIVARMRGWDLRPDSVASKPAINTSSKSVGKPEWDPKIRDLVMRLELPALVHFDYLSAQEREFYGIPANLDPHSALRKRSVPDTTCQQPSVVEDAA